MWSLVCAPFLHSQGISFGAESQLLPNLSSSLQSANLSFESLQIQAQEAAVAAHHRMGTSRCLVREQE